MVTQQSAPSSSASLHIVTGVASYDSDFYHRTFHFFVFIHHLFEASQRSPILLSPKKTWLLFHACRNHTIEPSLCLRRSLRDN